MTPRHLPEPAGTPSVTVAGLLDTHPEAIGFGLEVVAGRYGLDRAITSPYIQKTGLALAGLHDYLQPGRILIFGESELRFLEALPLSDRGDVLARAFRAPIPCVIVTGGGRLPEGLPEAAEHAGLPLLTTATPTAAVIGMVTALLEERLAKCEVVHGVLVDVLGLGVLIIGESGIGKSECALDLVVRGHRLVADDIVEVRRRAEFLIGSCPELTRHHMEVRGLGVINISDLFGVASTRSAKRIELVVQLERWDARRELERLGLDEHSWELLSLKLPFVRMPVGPGRNLAILVEVAARNQLLRMQGVNAARDLATRLDAQLEAAADDAMDDTQRRGEDQPR